MSPPEIWGPAVWSLFHTLAVNIDNSVYPIIYVPLFNHIRNICSALPCPECASDASKFLAKININTIKTKEEFINTFYLFHNFVNNKKRKPLFNHVNMNIYIRYNIIDVLNNFINKYNTKGNMKLLNESFQRQIIVKSFKKWFISNINAFIKLSIKYPVTVNPAVKANQIVIEENNESPLQITD
jgi:hypothetical protein